MRNYTPFIVLLILAFTSCTPYKKILLFQPTETDSLSRIVDTAYRPVIQPNDILDVYVMSTSPEASKYFNYSNEVGANSQLAGYLVDKQGEIHLPIVGPVRVVGLNSSDARDTVARRLSKYLVDPSVKLSIRNFRVTILGEVLRPGVYAVPNEKMTLPEALALSGDLTMFSERYNVTVIRDSAGYKSYGEVNLNTRELFSSGYYNLHANDILYVKPTRKKRFQGENFYRTVPFYLSAFSFVLTLITVLDK